MIVDIFLFAGQVFRLDHGVHDFSRQLFPSELGTD